MADDEWKDFEQTRRIKRNRDDCPPYQKGTVVFVLKEDIPLNDLMSLAECKEPRPLHLVSISLPPQEFSKLGPDNSFCLNPGYAATYSDDIADSADTPVKHLAVLLDPTG